MYSLSFVLRQEILDFQSGLILAAKLSPSLPQSK